MMGYSESVGIPPVEVPRQPESDNDVVMVYSSPADVIKPSSGNGIQSEKALKRTLKRKRVTIDTNIGPEEKEHLINKHCEELGGLFKYFNQVLAWKLGQEGEYTSLNSAMACMLEGSNLPFASLADGIYDRLKMREGVTLASVQRDLHFISSRLNYGIVGENLNLLEDESESCLWCWEVRDLKLLPKNKRTISTARRKGREKVRDRVAAISEMLSVLKMPESECNYQTYLLKASEKLGKTLSLEKICSAFEKLTQKSADEIAKNEIKLKEKELLKEIERNIRSAEKEKKKLDQQLQKDKSQSVRELKRCQIEADKEERRREKEEAEMKKQQKRQHESERGQKRREKEEAEARKQLSIKKQASIMERFLKSKKCNGLEMQAGKISAQPLSSGSSGGNGDRESITISMDSVLFQRDSMNIEDLWKFHITAWRKLHHSNMFQHWGVRCKPKTVAFNELKLQGTTCKLAPLGNFKEPRRGNACSYVKGNDKSDSSSFSVEIEELSVTNQAHDNNDGITLTSIQLSRRASKLLQFDKSHRPAYYGSWSKKSSLIGARHPFAKDPDLDYDVDSDEEWEEEEPGESLSDCDKDEEEILEEDPRADDDEESEDGFFVPDGYLSENEGIQDDDMRSDAMSNEAQSSPSCGPEIENEECSALLQQQRYIDNLTHQALRKNQPLIITNLLYEKSEIVQAKDITGILKVEQIFLQTLCLVACTEGPIIDQPVVNRASEDPDVCHFENKVSTASTAAAAMISDPNLPEYVRCIQSNPNGMAKMLELLQQKFPNLPKVQLRNKVKEISEFVNNRWQVKKEVLEKLGMSTSPDKGGRPKGISTFFSSKRCLPPTGQVLDLSEASPRACPKAVAPVSEGTQGCQQNLQVQFT